MNPPLPRNQMEQYIHDILRHAAKGFPYPARGYEERCQKAASDDLKLEPTAIRYEYGGKRPAYYSSDIKPANTLNGSSHFTLTYPHPPPDGLITALKQLFVTMDLLGLPPDIITRDEKDPCCLVINYPENIEHYIRYLRQSAFNLNIDFIKHDEIPAVHEIESKSFGFPWNEEEFIKHLSKEDVTGLAARANGKVVGYLIYQGRKGHLDVLNFAVDPNARNMGIASAMMERFMGKIGHQGRDRLYIEIHEEAGSALEFLKAQGFVSTHTLRGEADDGKDLYVLQFHESFIKHPFHARSEKGQQAIMEQLRERGEAQQKWVDFQDAKKAHLTLPAPEKKTNEKPRHLLERMQDALENMTGVEWDIVRPVNDGEFNFERVEITSKSNLETLFFSTREKVMHPAQAHAALCKYFGQEIDLYFKKQQKPREVLFPANWVREIHVTQARPNLLAGAFSAAPSLAHKLAGTEEGVLSTEYAYIGIHASPPDTAGGRTFTFMIEARGKPKTERLVLSLPHNLQMVATAISQAIDGEKTTLGIVAKIASTLKDLPASPNTRR